MHGISSQQPLLIPNGFVLVTEWRPLFYSHSHPTVVLMLGKEAHNQGQNKCHQQMGPGTKDSETRCILGSSAALLVLGLGHHKAQAQLKPACMKPLQNTEALFALSVAQGVCLQPASITSSGPQQGK